MVFGFRQIKSPFVSDWPRGWTKIVWQTDALGLVDFLSYLLDFVDSRRNARRNWLVGHRGKPQAPFSVIFNFPNYKYRCYNSVWNITTANSYFIMLLSFIKAIIIFRLQTSFKIRYIQNIIWHLLHSTTQCCVVEEVWNMDEKWLEIIFLAVTPFTWRF